ncbi:hypothetical protein FAI41_03970 [Acetobacteraceae bacterium]|nr:hypothetical protein FAI41_03970 [Acetobacteraceae bacterium]
MTAHAKKLETKIQPNNFQACLKKAGQIKANKKAGVSEDFSLAETEDQLQFNPDNFLPSLGQAVISKLSNPAYHSPYLEAEKNRVLAPKPTLTQKQIRILKRHKILHRESFPAFLTSPPMGMENVPKAKKIGHKKNTTESVKISAILKG